MQHVSDGMAISFIKSSIHTSSIKCRVAANARPRSRCGRAQPTLLIEWQQGEYVRIKIIELLFVKAGKIATRRRFRVSEQQVANIRFAAVKKIGEHVKNAGLPIDVFPELKEEGPA